MLEKKHATCVETTGSMELLAGQRSYACGPDCPRERAECHLAPLGCPGTDEGGHDVWLHELNWIDD
jgi:hypothetical protein